MKTLITLFVLGAAATAEAAEPKNLLDLLREPSPAVTALLADDGVAAATALDAGLRVAEESVRTTRSITAQAAAGAPLTPKPGRNVELR